MASILIINFIVLQKENNRRKRTMSTYCIKELQPIEIVYDVSN